MYTLLCLYYKSDYAVSSIWAFSDSSPYVSSYSCKGQKWHNLTNPSNDTYSFEQMQRILADTVSFFVVSYEKTKSVKLITFLQAKQKHKCTDRCNQSTQVTIPKLVKTPSPDFACVENGRLCDKTIDIYHQLLRDRVVGKNAYICHSTFVSQKLSSVFCDDMSVLPDVPKTSDNWWKFDMVILPVNLNDSHWGAIAVDFSKKTVNSDNIVLHVVLMDSLCMYEKEIIKVFGPLRKYLALQYVALHGRDIGITFNYECYHSCPHFIAQTDASSCGIFTCLFSKAVLFDVSLNSYKSQGDKRDCVMYELSTAKLLL